MPNFKETEGFFFGQPFLLSKFVVVTLSPLRPGRFKGEGLPLCSPLRGNTICFGMECSDMNVY